MLRLSWILFPLLLAESGAPVSATASFAWPHRAILSSLHGRPVPFRAYSLGGDLIIAVDASGQPTTTPAGTPRLRALTPKDTIRLATPANFPLDLSKGAVVFVAEGTDSLRLAVSRNPWPGSDQVTANGRRFTVSLVAGKFVIATR